MGLSILLLSVTYLLPKLYPYSMANSKNTTFFIGGGIAVVFLIVVVVMTVFRGQRFSGLEPLPIVDFRNSPNNHQGNSYLLEGQIQALLLWEEGVGRLLAVTPNSDNKRIVVFVPDSLDKSLHTGQRYQMAVSIGKGGLVQVSDLDKF